MMSAVCAAQGGASVILIEHTARLGSKILQTGNGKCNFTNLHMNASCYQNDNPRFVMQVLKTFPVQATLDFFENAGIYHKERNGYIYPHSETAASLQSALRYEVQQNGVTVFTEQSVSSIERRTICFMLQRIQLLSAPVRVFLPQVQKLHQRPARTVPVIRLQKMGHHIVKPLPHLYSLLLITRCANPWQGCAVQATSPFLPTAAALLQIPEKSSIPIMAFQEFLYFR